MKHFIFSLLMLLIFTSCSANEPEMPEQPQPVQPGEGGGSDYFSGKNVLIAYFSWGGTTRRMAQQVQAITGGDLFEIEPVNPYPTSYTPCTEVALEERDSNARPAIKNSVANRDEYDVVFLGGPVWWHTAPMILHTFAESYDFEGKTVVPFTTYASTYRDETLQAIVDMTPDADHLEGLGLTSGSINESRIQTWIDLINEQYGSLNPGGATAPMEGTVELWQKGNIPGFRENVNNSDGPDFMPNMLVYTVPDNVQPKGAVMICPGGAFTFRSMQNEGYDIADMLVPMGYQCFIVNYRINPYSMHASATDLQRAIRYVKAHAEDYRINPENIALVGFSAGGILNGEVLLNWRDLTNGTALDSSYCPDELDNVPVSACAVGMIYSFYGRLSVSMNNVETLRAANLPPAFYCWGTRDGFADQFTQNSNAVKEAGVRVETKVLQGYPHGYGSGGNASIWGNDFDAFLTPIMQGNSAAINTINADMAANTPETYYDLKGRVVSLDTLSNGIYIVESGKSTRKVLKTN
ncbi:flavodoxin [uncultured Duncaniella sp.]|uniref:flavodoxin n=1 Tax=uncultured Duncaniella sp. TaxID=2768039 RepID=UPI00321FD5CF